MEAPEIIALIKRRRDSLKNSSMIADPSEILVTRADMTRMLANEYDDIVREIEGAKEPGSLSERRSQSRP